MANLKSSPFIRFFPDLSAVKGLRGPAMIGSEGIARGARQGGLVPYLGVAVTADQSRQVWAVADRLRTDLEALPA